MSENIRLELLKLIMRPGVGPVEAIAMATALEAWVCGVQASKVESDEPQEKPRRRYTRRAPIDKSPVM